MHTIIRRYRRRRTAPAFATLATIVLGLALAAGVFMVLWIKGGPQPVHEIVIAIPAPAVPAATGGRA